MTVAAPCKVGFERILVPTDFSDVSQKALKYASSIAQASEAKLVLAHVCEPVSPITPPEVIWFEQFAGQPVEERQLENIAEELHSEGLSARAALLIGSIQTELLNLAKREEADLIVMGTHARTGLGRLFRGSETESLFRSAPCPILAVGPAARPALEMPWHPREILCACDLDPDSAATAAYALRLGKQYGAHVTILHVDDSEVHGSREMRVLAFEFSLEALLGESHRLECKAEYLWRVLMIGVSMGSTVAAIATERQADLLVLGAHRATPAQTHFARGIAPEAIAKASCPVLVLHR